MKQEMKEKINFLEGRLSMTEYVIDASVVLEWVKSSEMTQKSVINLQEEIVDGKIIIHAPSFLLVEVLNVLSRKYRHGKGETEAFLKFLLQFPIRYIDTQSDSVFSLLDLVYRYELSGYDALYLATAQSKKCRLISLDKKLLQVKDWVIHPQIVV